MERVQHLQSLMGPMSLKEMDVYVFGRAGCAEDRLLRLELRLRVPCVNEYVSTTMGTGRIMSKHSPEGEGWSAVVRIRGVCRRVSMRWEGEWVVDVFAEPGEVPVGTVVLHGLSEGVGCGPGLVQLQSGIVQCRLKHFRDVRVDQRGGVWQTYI